MSLLAFVIHCIYESKLISHLQAKYVAAQLLVTEDEGMFKKNLKEAMHDFMITDKNDNNGCNI